MTGGQWYSDTSPFSIPCLIDYVRTKCVRTNRSNDVRTNIAKKQHDRSNNVITNGD